MCEHDFEKVREYEAPANSFYDWVTESICLICKTHRKEMWYL